MEGQPSPRGGWGTLAKREAVLLASAAVRQVLDEACHRSAVTWCASQWASLEQRQGLQMFPFSLGMGAEMVLH